MTDKRILAVDDEPGVCEFMAVALDEFGYQCETAQDACTAEERLSRERFDLMLLDVMMPGCWGVDLYRRLRQQYPDLAVVFVTARDDLDLRSITAEAGGLCDYLIKPVSLSSLEEVIERTLARREEALAPVS